MSCVVPGCKSNYRKENAYTSTFSFPTDNDTREMWFRAIPRRREDYETNKYLKVCIHHFHDEDIERKFIYFDGNKMVEMPRKRIALKKSAIPSIFPDCSILRGVRKSETSSRSPTRGKKYTGCVMLLYPLK